MDVWSRVFGHASARGRRRRGRARGRDRPGHDRRAPGRARRRRRRRRRGSCSISAAVTFIDSAGVRLVLEAMRALPEFAVVRGGHEVARVFKLVGLDERVRIVDQAAGRGMTGRVAAVGLAAAAAAGAARSWRRLRADRQRYALIRGAALIADSGGTIPEVIERVRALLVPAFADACEIRLGERRARPRRDARRPAALARADDRHHGAQGAVGLRGPRVCAAARRPDRARAGERPARVARGLADHRARHAGRSGHDPGRPRRARVRQRRGGRRARLRLRRAAAGHAAAPDRGRLRVLQRGRVAAARSSSCPPAG